LGDFFFFLFAKFTKGRKSRKYVYASRLHISKKRGQNYCIAYIKVTYK
jgi:hypothetical protein